MRFEEVIQQAIAQAQVLDSGSCSGGSAGQLITVRRDSGGTVQATCFGSVPPGPVTLVSEGGRWFALSGNTPLLVGQRVATYRQRRPDEDAIASGLIQIFVTSKQGRADSEKQISFRFYATDGTNVLLLHETNEFDSSQVVGDGPGSGCPLPGGPYAEPRRVRVINYQEVSAGSTNCNGVVTEDTPFVRNDPQGNWISLPQGFTIAIQFPPVAEQVDDTALINTGSCLGNQSGTTITRFSPFLAIYNETGDLVNTPTVFVSTPVRTGRYNQATVDNEAGFFERIAQFEASFDLEFEGTNGEPLETLSIGTSCNFGTGDPEPTRPALDDVINEDTIVGLAVDGLTFHILNEREFIAQMVTQSYPEDSTTVDGFWVTTVLVRDWAIAVKDQQELTGVNQSITYPGNLSAYTDWLPTHTPTTVSANAVRFDTAPKYVEASSTYSSWFENVPSSFRRQINLDSNGIPSIIETIDTGDLFLNRSLELGFVEFDWRVLVPPPTGNVDITNPGANNARFSTPDSDRSFTDETLVSGDSFSTPITIQSFKENFELYPGTTQLEEFVDSTRENLISWTGFKSLPNS